MEPARCGNTCFLKQGPDSKTFVAMILGDPEKKWETVHVAVRFFRSNMQTRPVE